MLERLLIAASFVFAAGSAMAPAAAQEKADLTKAAISGQRIRIDAFYHLNPDCSLVGYPTVRVVSGPSAGRVEVRKEKSFPSFAADNARARCNSQRAPATAVYYTSNRRFTGSDNFALELYWTDGDVWTRNVAVDVR